VTYQNVHLHKTSRGFFVTAELLVSSCCREYVRPSASRHIQTVTRGFQVASQDFPVFLPSLSLTYYMTYILFFSFSFFFLAFAVHLAMIDII